jgi:hypothetical protein
VLNAKPVARLARQVEQAFPLLDFACWSTEQVRSFGHLLFACFVAFIHTERDAMASVADRLRDAGYDSQGPLLAIKPSATRPPGVGAASFSTLLRQWNTSSALMCAWATDRPPATRLT